MLIWLFIYPNSPSGNSCLFAQALALPEPLEHSYIPQDCWCPQRPCDTILLQLLPSASSALLLRPGASHGSQRKGSSKAEPGRVPRPPPGSDSVTALAAGSWSLSAISNPNPKHPEVFSWFQALCHQDGLPQSCCTTHPSTTMAAGDGTGTPELWHHHAQSSPSSTQLEGFPVRAWKKLPQHFFLPVRGQARPQLQQHHTDITPGAPCQEQAASPTSHLGSHSCCGKEPAYHLVAISTGKPKTWITRLGLL